MYGLPILNAKNTTKHDKNVKNTTLLKTAFNIYLSIDAQAFVVISNYYNEYEDPYDLTQVSAHATVKTSF